MKAYFDDIRKVIVENHVYIKTKSDLIQVLAKQGFSQHDDFDLERVLRWAAHHLIISNIENYQTKLDVCSIALTNGYKTVQEILDYVHAYFTEDDVQCFTEELIKQELEFISKLVENDVQLYPDIKL